MQKCYETLMIPKLNSFSEMMRFSSLWLLSNSQYFKRYIFFHTRPIVFLLLSINWNKNIIAFLLNQTLNIAFPLIQKITIFLKSSLLDCNGNCCAGCWIYILLGQTKSIYSKFEIQYLLSFTVDLYLLHTKPKKVIQKQRGEKKF